MPKRTAGQAGIYKKGAKVFRKSAAAKSVAKQIKKAVAKGQIGGEVKGMDTSLALNPVIATTNTNASVFVLNLMQQGNASWERVGRKAHLQSVRIKCTFAHAFTTTAVTGAVSANQLRMVVVWDKQPSSGAIPTFDTIFGRTDQTGAESCQFIDPPRYDNMDRFSVLRDKLYDMNVTATNLGTAAQVINLYHCDEFIKLNGRETVYSGTANPLTIASISTGALYVYFRAQLNSAADNITAVNDDAVARLRYTE